MLDMFTGAVVMYFLGVILLLGVTESIDEDSPHASKRFALTWPLISVLVILEMLVELFNGKQR